MIMEDINYDEEEARLQAELQKIRERKAFMYEYNNAHALALRMDEEYERLKAEATKPVMIEDVELIGDTLHFKLSHNREDVYEFVKTLKGFTYNYLTSDFSIIPTELSKLLDFIRGKNIYIKYSTDANTIKQWKPAPPYAIEMDSRGLLVTIGQGVINYELNRIPGNQYHTGKRQYRIPFTEAWRIVDAIPANAQATWSDEAKAYIEKQIEMRGKLDEIAKQERASFGEVCLANDNKLKDFQAVAVEFAEAAGSTLIADEMGLGKTPTGIAIFERRVQRGEAKKALVVVPAKVKPKWIREIYKFSGVSCYECYGSRPSNYDMAQVIAGGYRYILINYDILAEVTKIPEQWEVNEQGERIKTPEQKRFLWAELMNMAGFDTLIIDEIHYIKNVESNRSNAVRELQIPHVIGLSGTPMLNRPGELWAPLSVLDKEAAGSYEGFIQRYTYDGKSARNVEELREMLKTRMIRRTKKDVLKELPPINRITQDTTLSVPARKQYELVLAGLWGDLDSLDDNLSNTQAITSILAKLMRMKQVCALDKVEYTVDLANDLYEQTSDETHRKVIIVSQFVNEPPVVHKIAERLNVGGMFNEALIAHGGMTPSERQKVIDVFQTDPSKKFLVAGMKAISEGLDITAAGAVIFNDLDWTPGNHHQCEARAYGRMSDLHSINSYYVITDNTIEEDIWALLEHKINMFNAIIEGTEQIRDSSVAMELIRKLKESR